MLSVEIILAMIYVELAVTGMDEMRHDFSTKESNVISIVFRISFPSAVTESIALRARISMRSHGPFPSHEPPQSQFCVLYADRILLAKPSKELIASA